MFQKRPVRAFSTCGTPYLRWVSFGMPAIPSTLLHSVCYLYPDKESAREGRDSGGTGFLVGIRIEADRSLVNLYLVSNYHVAIKNGNSVIRVNKKDGSCDIFEHDPSEWHFVRGGGDVAAIPMKLDMAVHDVTYLDVSGLAKTPQELAHIGPGDDIFMIGRFIDHDGGNTNKPAARFGNVSIDPTYIPGCSNSGLDVKYYCLDMHSRSGFSGSPVWAYMTPGSDLRQVDLTEDRSGSGWSIGPPRLHLLGIHCGQFREDMHVKNADGSDGPSIVGYSGMTYILPSWHIYSLLYSEPLAAIRLQNEEYHSARRAPWEEMRRRGPRQ